MIEVPWPKYIKYHWRCKLCTREHTSKFYSPRPGASEYDSFNFQCPCGAYYKTAGHIPTSSIIEVTEEKA